MAVALTKLAGSINRQTRTNAAKQIALYALRLGQQNANALAQQRYITRAAGEKHRVDLIGGDACIAK